MKNTFGNSVAVTLFGESHGEYIGAVIDGLSPGIEISHEYIAHMLTLRRPDGKISTPRKEKDEFKINLNDLQKKVLDIISIEAKSFDEIINSIELDTAELMITLTELEIKGLILQENSKYYKCK
jgi:predicted Rossmann fold nucleotide-binding protein DprA/Smf involved in DNA uptake